MGALKRALSLALSEVLTLFKRKSYRPESKNKFRKSPSQTVHIYYTAPYLFLTDLAAFTRIFIKNITKTKGRELDSP